MVGGTRNDTRVIDLRSDTVTRATLAMRRAMADAEVGDDQLGDDPTTRQLEDEVAALLGKERALFFPTGIMANQTALAVHAAWGSEVVVEADSHLVHWEDGASAALKGLQLRPVRTDDGILRAQHLDTAVRPDSRYLPRTSLVCIENTHLAHGGRAIGPADVEALAEAAHDRGLPVHLDGARLWHAAAALGVDVAQLAAAVDSVMVAMSKGLGAPVGSLLAGEAGFIDEAWRIRRRLGGSMRQSGHLAAAGLVALRDHRDRLLVDHAHARAIAAALREIEGLDVPIPETNVVMARCAEPDPRLGAPLPESLLPGPLLKYLQQNDILMLDFGNGRLRAVTHLGIDADDVARVCEVVHAYAHHRGHATAGEPRHGEP